MHEIEPHEFFGGIEVENNTTLTSKCKDFEVPPLVADAFNQLVLQRLPGSLHREDTGTSGHGTDGRRSYLDVGSHIEIASGESRSYRELVHMMIAGEYLLVKAVLDTLKTEKYAGKYSAVLLGRVIDSNGTSWGIHENYRVSRQAYAENIPGNVSHYSTYNNFRRVMLSHLATRYLFSGGGLLRPTENDPANVIPSQKSSKIFSDIGSGTTNNRALFNSRDEAHTKWSKKYARMHVTNGEYLISPYSLWLTLGTTDIVAYLASTGFLNHTSGLYLQKGEAYKIAQKVGSDLSSKFQLENGTYSNTQDLQDRLCSLAEGVAQSQPYLFQGEDIEIITEWRNTIDQSKRDKSSLTDRIDHLGRSDLLRRYFDKKACSEERLYAVEEYWDNLIIGKAVEQRTQSGMPGYDENAIKGYILKPPMDTRANVRAKIIQLLAHIPDISIRSVDWNTVYLQRDKEYKQVDLDDECYGVPDEKTLSQLSSLTGEDIGPEYFEIDWDCCTATA